MKRWIAAMLAVIMLFGATALAEDSAAVLTVDNVRAQKGDQTVDIRDLSMNLALQNVDGLPAVALRIDGAGEPLAIAVGELTDKQLSFAVDGIGYGYAVPLPSAQAAQLAQVGDAGLAMLVPALVPMLREMRLPYFEGADIPALDLKAALSDFITMTSNGTSEFEIPAEVFDDLLNQALQLARMRGDNLRQLDSVIQLLEGLKAEGKGVAIKGVITGNGASQKVEGDISMVSGRNSSKTLASFTVTSALNSWKLTVAVRKGFLSLNVLTATLVSRPSEARVDFEVGVFGGLDMRMALYREDGMQKVSFYADGLGMQSRLEFAFGQVGNGELVSFSAVLDDASVSADLRTAAGADGVRTGTLVCSMTRGGSVVGLRGDVTMSTGDGIDLGGFSMPAEMRPIDQLDRKVVKAAFAPVKDYVRARAAVN